jgi:hypothetical protein
MKPLPKMTTMRRLRPISTRSIPVPSRTIDCQLKREFFEHANGIVL